MANTFTYQKLMDSNKKTIIKLTGMFDSNTQESNTKKIQANTLNGALDANNNFLVTGNTAKSFYGLSVYRVWYDVNVNGYVSLFWSGDSNTTILNMKNVGEYNMAGNWISIPNNNLSGNVSGDIGIITNDAVANNSYSIIIELHKDSNYYNYGQLNEPNVFNYGRYGVTP